jgi:hypothetical protein
MVEKVGLYCFVDLVWVLFHSFLSSLISKILLLCHHEISNTAGICFRNIICCTIVEVFLEYLSLIFTFEPFLGDLLNWIFYILLYLYYIVCHFMHMRRKK